MAISATCSLRHSLMLFIMMQAIVMNTLAARHLFGSSPTLGHGRALLNTGKVLTDYIGASGNNMHFTDVPIHAGVEYIFPLAFAIDADGQGKPTNGVFSPYWSSSLTPQSARSFLEKHKNVRISVSLAGASQYVNGKSQNIVWYDPINTEKWIDNAVSSITRFAKEYHITGIDIDYEDFTKGSAKFTTCIGGLITKLKNAGTIKVASIAPFSSILTQYTHLYNTHASSIDYVNYQFYAEGLTSVSQYVSKFHQVAKIFPATKLMASVNVEKGTVQDPSGLQGQKFMNAVGQLSTYAGIMIWEADDSKASHFSMEHLAATHLASS